MQIFETEPISFLCSLSQKLERELILITTHWEFVESILTDKFIGMLLNLFRWVETDTYNKETWNFIWHLFTW